MIVFFSDIHLTDGSSGESINPEAFDLFAEEVAQLARKRKCREVRVILLGDGLDVIRSARWSGAPAACRPWGRRSPEQEAVVLEILGRVLDHNGKAIACLRNLPGTLVSRAGLSRGDVSFDYLLGNHDWLVNRYDSARKLVAGALDLPPAYVTGGFPVEYSSPPGEYDVIARHGDVHDLMNFDRSAGRDASSLGDAVVIEILNRFPAEVERMFPGDPRVARVVNSLREIDNVRPFASIPAWIADVLAEMANNDPAYVSAVKDAISRCVKDLRRNSVFRRFMRRQFGLLQRLYVHIMLDQLNRTRIGKLNRVTRAGELAKRAWAAACMAPYSTFIGHALKERAGDGHLPRFVVYGHTHDADIVPLSSSAHSTAESRYYLNTGTWRTVWSQGETADGTLHFDSWEEMTYAVVYHRGEPAGKHGFELWTGSMRASGE